MGGGQGHAHGCGGLTQPAGDLLTLKDGKNQTTTWTYDAEGRVKEKWYQGQSTADLVYWYDADGRLTNRLTRTGTGASTNGYSTLFSYDATGSLTNVDYPVGTTDLKYAYDALGRLTNMVDASGPTTYAYAVGGGKEIISEDGPWNGTGDVLTVTNPDLIGTVGWGPLSAGPAAAPP